jgi:hypothetical protein
MPATPQHSWLCAVVAFLLSAVVADNLLYYPIYLVVLHRSGLFRESL